MSYENHSTTFRDGIRSLSPGWLRGTQAGGILYAVGLVLDGLIDMTAAGIMSRFPGYYTGQTLPRSGRERKISRGRSETDDSYASRLQGWRSSHRLRGNPGELLRQFWAYWGGAYAAALVNSTGLRLTLSAIGVITWDLLTEWSPLDTPYRWPQWWLFVDGTPFAATADGTWGSGGTWGDGAVWGSSLTPEQVAELRATPQEWNARHCRDAWIVLLDTGLGLWGYPEAVWGEPGDVWGSDEPVIVHVSPDV
jgi:hypothetical protein